MEFNTPHPLSSYRWTMCGPNPSTDACTGAQAEEQYRKCCLWNVNGYHVNGKCPNPCILLNVKCPDYGICEPVLNNTMPDYKCVCTLGFVLNAAKDACIKPPPPVPTPRPIPTLAPAQKIVCSSYSEPC